jgi:hypothetical protein
MTHLQKNLIMDGNQQIPNNNKPPLSQSNLSITLKPKFQGPKQPSIPTQSPFTQYTKKPNNSSLKKPHENSQYSAITLPQTIKKYTKNSTNSNNNTKQFSNYSATSPIKVNTTTIKTVTPQRTQSPSPKPHPTNQISPLKKSSTAQKKSKSFNQPITINQKSTKPNPQKNPNPAKPTTTTTKCPTQQKDTTLKP